MKLEDPKQTSAVGWGRKQNLSRVGRKSTEGQAPRYRSLPVADSWEGWQRQGQHRESRGGTAGRSASQSRMYTQSSAAGWVVTWVSETASVLANHSLESPVTSDHTAGNEETKETKESKRVRIRTGFTGVVECAERR